MKEIYSSSFGDPIEVLRHNTLIDGYVPIIREIQGMLSLIQGFANVMFGAMASLTNEELSLRGRAQLKDGIINITYSPLTIAAIGFVAIPAILNLLILHH